VRGGHRRYLRAEAEQLAAGELKSSTAAPRGANPILLYDFHTMVHIHSVSLSTTGETAMALS
jgi:hypothetical protein